MTPPAPQLDPIVTYRVRPGPVDVARRGELVEAMAELLVQVRARRAEQEAAARAGEDAERETLQGIVDRMEATQ